MANTMSSSEVRDTIRTIKPGNKFRIILGETAGLSELTVLQEMLANGQIVLSEADQERLLKLAGGVANFRRKIRDISRHVPNLNLTFEVQAGEEWSTFRFQQVALHIDNIEMQPALAPQEVRAVLLQAKNGQELEIVFSIHTPNTALSGFRRMWVYDQISLRDMDRASLEELMGAFFSDHRQVYVRDLVSYHHKVEQRTFRFSRTSQFSAKVFEAFEPYIESIKVL